MYGGYANRLAFIDLTTQTVRYEPMDEALARKYIGGRGLGVKFVLDNGPQVEPFSPENLLCMMTGPLTGTQVNMSGRMAVVTRSPLTGTVTDSHIGGWTAAKLKWAGFDGLLFRGKAERPVYAFVENSTVTLKDATDLWGLGVRETVHTLQQRHGAECSVMAIGPAGEHLVRFAGWINENDRAAGRGGTGAVGGSKHLKAIVIKSNEKQMPKPPDAATFKVARTQGLKAIMSSPVTAPNKGGLSVYGTNVLMNMMNVVGGVPTYNGRRSDFDQAEAISGEAVREHLLVSEPTCHACPVACKKEVEVKEGPYKVRVESFEYESAWALGANCGNGNRDAIAFMIDLCNEFGLDTIEMGNALSTAMELQEIGALDAGLTWGDADAMIAALTKTAVREGIGDLLAEGPARLAARCGHPELANVVKGQAIAAYDPRAVQGMGLSYATSNRGGCHLRGYTIAAEMMGIPQPVDRTVTEGKAALLKTFQDLHAFSDCLDLCKFSAFAESAEEYAEQYTGMTGIPITPEDVLTIGERIYTLERYYNQLAGFTQADDTLPPRFLKEPGTGGSAGMVSHLNEMLPEYYEVRGWPNGVVPEEKLRALGILE